MRTSVLARMVALSSLAWACSPAGTEPHAMSAAEHQAAARQEEQAAEEHAAQFKPEAAQEQTTCAPRAAGRDGSPVCWTSLENPTAQHAHDAEEHRALAAKHREASQALRAAEASACAGIDAEDRDTSPFDHREDIASVSQYNDDAHHGKGTSSRTAGATIVFRAVPGMTAEWMQRLVDCHIARNSAIGHESAMADMPSCPLAVRGAQATVRSVGNGFAITVRADEDPAAKEILRRAESLKPASVAAQ